MSGEQQQPDGLRLRRAQSETRAEEIHAEERKVRQSQPDKPCHHPRDSLFSWNSGFDNFTGFINWAFLLLSIGGFRLLLENFIKYELNCIFICPDIYSFVPLLICLIIEKGLASVTLQGFKQNNCSVVSFWQEILATGLGIIAHVSNLLVLLLIPIVSIYSREGFSLIGASSVSFVYSLLFLKLWSYVQVNMWCRTKQRQSKSKNMKRQSHSYSNLQKYNNEQNGHVQDDADHPDVQLVQYPDNLNLRDLFYFIAAPTLCYELNFPRTDRIRKRFLLKRSLEVVLGLQLAFALMQQYMIPSVRNSLVPFSNMDVTKATERLLKLAIPNHLVWLLMFYVMFHSFLNLMGEVMQFADRNFYCDWWNANNIDTFWRTWNMPVHRWAVRHLYIPLVGMRYSKLFASIAVFFVSAFFHEYLVSVPLKTFKVWAFMGMMGQIPLSFISRFMEVKVGPRWGNVVVWASLIIGQPLCIMIYYHDYVIQHYGESLIKDYDSLSY
ncbi:sterol o-acyltransferase [Holotrichia oblita]|uniref:Sterol o-acyltransferase n=1 Tax=Holotrichia oblita TaxID=644536 RepID=A0ACB9TCE8_HOLOL|nr:sterol o-acyltransferase [Holotrichia oblita]